MEFNTNPDLRPLHGTRIVELSPSLAGPHSAMMLGDLGAEVVKIESTGDGGDFLRKMEPKEQFFDILNRNKQSIGIDLKTERGQDVATDLISTADVFLEASPPGRMEEFNLEYDTLREECQGIIYCSIRGFGSGSPYEGIPAWDLVIQAMSGAMSVTGESDGDAIPSGFAIGDVTATIYITQSILAALVAKMRDLIDSEHIEISLLDAAIACLHRSAHTFGTDEPFPRYGRKHPSQAPFGVFSCLDEDIVLGASTDPLWEKFCDTIARAELISDTRFNSFESRAENADELYRLVEPIIESKPQEYWLEEFHQSGVPAAPVQTTKSIWEDEHAKQRNLRREVEKSNGEKSYVINTPIRYKNLEAGMTSPPPVHGEDSYNLLSERLSYEDDIIKSLLEDSVVE